MDNFALRGAISRSSSGCISIDRRAAPHERWTLQSSSGCTKTTGAVCSGHILNDRVEVALFLIANCSKEILVTEFSDTSEVIQIMEITKVLFI